MKHPKYSYFFTYVSKVIWHCLLFSVTLNTVVVIGQTKEPWTITGKAVGSDGVPMANTRVSATLLTVAGIKGAPPVVTQGIATRTFTATDGSFQITGGGLGDYVICINLYTASQEYLS